MTKRFCYYGRNGKQKTTKRHYNNVISKDVSLNDNGPQTFNRHILYIPSSNSYDVSKATEICKKKNRPISIEIVGHVFETNDKHTI